MASPVYSTPFLAAHDLIGAVSYVVPTGFVAIVRDLDVYFNDITGTTVQLVDAVSGGVIWSQDFPATIAALGHWRGRQVFEAGGHILVSSDHGNADIRLSGYLLTAT